MIGVLGVARGAATLNLEIKHPFLNSFPPGTDSLDLPGFVCYLQDVF